MTVHIAIANTEMVFQWMYDFGWSGSRQVRIWRTTSLCVACRRIHGFPKV